jgi:hypothetical protein
VAATVQLMQTLTEYVTTWTTVLALMTSVEYVTDQERSTSVDVQISLKETVTVMVTNLTP